MILFETGFSKVFVSLTNGGELQRQSRCTQRLMLNAIYFYVKSCDKQTLKKTISSQIELLL